MQLCHCDYVELQLNTLEAKYIVEYNVIADGLNQNEFDSNQISEFRREQIKKNQEKTVQAQAVKKEETFKNIQKEVNSQWEDKGLEKVETPPKENDSLNKLNKFLEKNKENK